MLSSPQPVNSKPKYYSEADTYAKLVALETKYDLFKYSFDGYSTWRLLRSDAALSFHSLSFQRAIAPAKWKRFASLLLQGIAELPAFLFPGRARYVVKTYSSVLREKENGKWKDVEFDYLLTEISDVYKLEVQNNPAFNDRKKTALIPVRMTTSGIDLASVILMKRAKPAHIKTASAQMAAVLQQEPELQFFTEDFICSVLSYFYWSKKIHKSLLKRIKPEFVFVSNTSEYSIVAAAQELGIKAIEFQHGVFTRNHKDALPGLALPYKSSLIVPDQLFLFGEFWKKELDKHGLYGDTLRVVGNVRIDHYRKARKAYLQKTGDNHTCRILLTTQGFAVPELIAFVSEFLTLAGEAPDFILHIKLHPGYDTNRSIYDEAFAGNKKVQVIAANDDPATFDLFTMADLHLSISSACHFDALGLDIPTVILALENHEIVLNLVAAGHASLAGTPAELVSIVANWKNLKLPPEVSDFYVKNNGLQNIKQAIGLTAEPEHNHTNV